MKKPLLSLIVFSFVLSVIFFTVSVSGSHSSGYTQQTIRGNKPFKVGQTYTPHDPIAITGDVQLSQTALDEEWPGTGVENDPYIIQNYYITQSATQASIEIVGVIQHVVVTNNLLSSSLDQQKIGVLISTAKNVSVIDNEIQNYGMGVKVENSIDITIQSNLITNNWLGSYLWMVEDVLFASNTITNSSGNAIYIDKSATINFHSNIIRYSNLLDTYNYNTISETDSLILFNNSFEFSHGYSLLLWYINKSHITWNQFHDPGGFLVFFNSYGNNITKNEFSNIGNIPNISLEQSTNNIISSNNFYSQSTAHNHISFFGAVSNLFHNNERGNYWSKYTGNDTDGDGIGDEPFEIDTSNQDRYPLVKPVDFTKPEITDYPTELTFTTNENVTITWTAFDQNPTTYNIYQDGTFTITGPFTNGTNTIDLGQLEAGTYSFTVTLYDKDANSAAFTTSVTITSAPESQTSESQASESQTSEDILNFISENIVQIAGVAIIAGVSLFILLKVLRRIRS
jgi:parallel beta-helix repeat protein